MKKVLKYLGLLIGLVLLIVLLGALYIQTSGIPNFENEAPDLTVEADSTMIEEGYRIASLLCNQCHMSEDGRLGGAHMPDIAEFGDIYSANITQHPEYGIANYTDGELAYLLRTGIKKDGDYSPPYMVKLPLLADRDLHSIIAFLRSDHPLVQPSDNQPPKSTLSFLSKFLLKVAFGPLPYPKETITAPDASDQLAFGEYLATAKFDCYSCHSGSFSTNDVLNPDASKNFLGGGNKMYQRDGTPIITPNLTMDKETGLGNWTEEQFQKAVLVGIAPSGEALEYPMAPYGQMTKEEVSAIWAYLKTIPEIHNPNG